MYKDPEKQREFQRNRVAQTRRDFFRGKSCKCGATTQLELDHIDPDKKESHRIWSWSIKRREEEIKKCQILCKRCHQRKTAEYRARNVTHGTLTMYKNKKCRCVECRKVNAQWVKNSRKQTLTT